MQINVEVKNAKEISRMLAVMPEAINNELDKAIAKAAFLIEREAKQVTPVRTGRLRASIVKEFSTKKAIIGPHTDYAYTVHEGTGFGRNSRPRPFMRWGVDAAQSQIDEIFKEAVDNALKKI